MPAKFIIVHHSACTAGSFHYLITAKAQVQQLLKDDQPGIHKDSLGVVIEGDFTDQQPTQQQIEALRELIVELSMRYPNIQLGGHRQVRSNQTDCPGAQFPLSELREWVTTKLETQRHKRQQTLIESQYLTF